jgi:hypothetical protein
MNIDQHLSEVVNNIVAQVTDTVDARIQAMIAGRVQEALAEIDLTDLIDQQLHYKLDNKIAGVPIDTGLIQGKIDDMTSGIVVALETEARTTVNRIVGERVMKADFNAVMQSVLNAKIADKLTDYTFPDTSIPGAAINTSGLLISGDNVKGGIITSFASTGIDDRASACQLTVFDEYTVSENNFITQSLTVKGKTTIEGDLVVTGTIPQDSPMFQVFTDTVRAQVLGSLDNHLFVNYSDLVLNRLKTEGLDLNMVKLNGQQIIDRNVLSPSITESNLTKLGVVRDLKTIGETLLNQTVYVSNQRVGINTVEPSRSLTVWDQEVELGMGKRSADTGIFGTVRNQNLVLSANAKDNLTLNTDGSVSVNQLNIGKVSVSSAELPPTTDSPKGTIVFNANPTLGGPLGWVSLGGARWANFGIID